MIFSVIPCPPALRASFPLPPTALTHQVAPANEALLMSQNPQLAKEYLEGVWAHETGAAEVGGLLARMPVEFQLVHLTRRARLSGKGQATPEETTPAVLEGDDAALAWGKKVRSCRGVLQLGVPVWGIRRKRSR